MTNDRSLVLVEPADDIARGRSPTLVPARTTAAIAKTRRATVRRRSRHPSRSCIVPKPSDANRTCSLRVRGGGVIPGTAVRPLAGRRCGVGATSPRLSTWMPLSPPRAPPGLWLPASGALGRDAPAAHRGFPLDDRQRRTGTKACSAGRGHATGRQRAVDHHRTGPSNAAIWRTTRVEA
jgi:hypothetical protein